MISLDSVDRQLLLELQRDSRQTHKDLAAKVKLAPASVFERIRKLERAGVILGYHARVNPEALDLHVTAFISLTLENCSHCRSLEAPLAAIPEIEELHSVAGQTDLLLKVRVKSPPSIEDLNYRLKSIPHVARTSTLMVLSTRFEARPHPIELPSGEAETAVSDV